MPEALKDAGLKASDIDEVVLVGGMTRMPKVRQIVKEFFGKEQQIRIQASGGLSDADIDQMVRDAEQFAEDDKKRRASAEAKNNAESLIHTTERQLAEHGDKVDAALKSEIEAAVAETKTAVEGGDADEMTQKAQNLAQVAMKLGQAIYEKEQATAAGGATDEGAGAATGSEAGGEDVVDAEFSEVNDENRG